MEKVKHEHQLNHLMEFVAVGMKVWKNKVDQLEIVNDQIEYGLVVILLCLWTKVDYMSDDFDLNQSNPMPEMINYYLKYIKSFEIHLPCHSV